MLRFLQLLVEEAEEEGADASNKKPNENISGLIKKAYEQTLKRHHGLISKQLFKVPPRSCILAVGWVGAGLFWAGAGVVVTLNKF